MTKPVLRPNRDCRYKSSDYCSFMIVNSIGNVFNKSTHPEARLKILRAQIEALNSVPSGYPLEIIVTDDNSDEATTDYLYECLKTGQINMLFLSKPNKLGNGFTKNIPLSFIENNLLSKSYLDRELSPYGQTGDRTFNPKYIALAENDVIPLKRNWLKEMVDILEHNKDVGFLNSIFDYFDEEDFHKVLLSKKYKRYTLEYRKLIPGSFYFTKTDYMQKVGMYTVWDLELTGTTRGYKHLKYPKEYTPGHFNGTWDEELSLRFAHHRLFGINVQPAIMEHRKLVIDPPAEPPTAAPKLQSAKRALKIPRKVAAKVKRRILR